MADVLWADIVGSIMPGNIPLNQQYQARKLAEDAVKKHGCDPNNMLITGHSLGGDLAAQANFALGGNIPTITFNAKGSIWIKDKVEDSTKAYRVGGEILTGVQEGLWGWSPVPDAAGLPIPLPPTPGKNAMDRHLMPSVMISLTYEMLLYCKDYSPENAGK